MRAAALVPLPCQTSHLAPRISRWTASRSSEPITLHPKTEVSAASNFIAIWNQSRMRQLGCAHPLAAFSNSPAVGQDRYAGIRIDPAGAQKPIEPLSCRTHLVLDIGTDPGLVVLEAGPTGHDVDVSPLAEFTRGIAVPEPCGIHSHDAQLPVGRNGWHRFGAGQSSGRFLEGFANDTHAPLHAGNRDRVVDRQELGQQRCGGRRLRGGSVPFPAHRRPAGLR